MLDSDTQLAKALPLKNQAKKLEIAKLSGISFFDRGHMYLLEIRHNILKPCHGHCTEVENIQLFPFNFEFSFQFLRDYLGVLMCGFRGFGCPGEPGLPAGKDYTMNSVKYNSSLST